MKLLAIGLPLPHMDVDNYNPLMAPSFFDYDALFVDPVAFTAIADQVITGEEPFETFDGRPIVNGPTTANAVGAGDQLRRRLEETQHLLEAGGTVIVVGRPNATRAGLVGFEGCDRYSWLPAPAGIAWGPPIIRAAEGKTIRIAAEDHPFASFLRDRRKELAYRAVFDERQPAVARAGRVIARGGSNVPIGMEFRHLGGRIVFIPVIIDEGGTHRATIAERLIEIARQLIDHPDTELESYWVGSVAVTGLEQVEAELEDADRELSAATERRDAARERHDELAAHRRLVTAEGRDLVDATRKALAMLGFVVTGEGPKIVIESEGQRAFVEVEGARDQVVEWPYVRLQRRLEEELLQNGTAPRGLVVANGQRIVPPEQRYQRFSGPLRIACENYHYCLLTGETLFALVQRVLGGADDSFLGGARRRILQTYGELDGPHALGEAEAPQDTGPIF
jgi:hypothetical protein